jgi:hypothetical protein
MHAIDCVPLLFACLLMLLPLADDAHSALPHCLR